MQDSRDHEIVLLPNLLKTNRHRGTPVCSKGNSYLKVEDWENPQTLLKPQFARHMQQHTLWRSESFHYDSLTDHDTFSPSEQQLSSHWCPGIANQDHFHLDSCSTSHLLKPWAPVVDPSSGSTYYWNQETNEVQWEIPQAPPGQCFLSTDTHKWSLDEPQGLRSILKGTHKWRSDPPAASYGCRIQKKVRFDLSKVLYVEPRAADLDAQEGTIFTGLEVIWGTVRNKLSESNLSLSLSLSLEEALSHVLHKWEL